MVVEEVEEGGGWEGGGWLTTRTVRWAGWAGPFAAAVFKALTQSPIVLFFKKNY